MRLPRATFPLAPPTWPAGVPRPAPERRVGLDYDHDWSRRYPARLVRAAVLDNVTRPLAQLVTPTTVRGREHLRHIEPPMIFVANHTSHIDTPLFLTTLPVDLRHRTVVAAASDYFFDRTWKSVLWSLSLAAIPIERNRLNRRSADVAAGLVEDGWNLVIFPEGGRSPDGWLQEFRGGAAYLARRTGRPVVPVHIDGTRDALAKDPETAERPPGGSGTEGRHTARLRRAPATVTFGPALEPQEGEDARRLAARIERAVSVLGAEARSDWWTARRLQAEGTLPDPRGPAASPWRRAWALGPRREPGQVERRARGAAEPRTERSRWPDLRPRGRGGSRRQRGQRAVTG